MYEVSPMTSRPERKRSSKATWPFAALTVGMQFTVPASDSSKFHACRSAASTYNKATNSNITCTLQNDGSLLVWNDTGDETLKLAPITIVAKSQPMSEAKSDPDKVPTHQQFIDWLETLAVNQMVTITKDQMGRYLEFVQWIEAYNKQSNLKQFYDEQSEQGMDIMRVDDIPEFARKPVAPAYQG